MRSDRTLFATAAMGTRFEIVIEARETTHIRATGEQAITEIERLHRLFSYFANDSLLSHINRSAAGAPVRLDHDSFDLLNDALHVWRESDGAFDASRGNGMDAVVLDPNHRTIRFTREGVSLDLGGIAKGHAVDNAARILRENGVESAFVHGGTSSVTAIGAPRESEHGWRVAIAPAPLHHVFMIDESLGTSSASLRNHIVDPTTGAYATKTRIAAIIGPSARLADAWSTAAAVLGQRPANLGTEWRCFIA